MFLLLARLIITQFVNKPLNHIVVQCSSLCYHTNMATRSLAKHYAGESSVHGIKRMFVSSSNQRFKLRRSIWAIFWLFAFAYTIYLIQDVLSRYLSYKSLTKFSIENAGFVPFPAMTMCYMNPLKWSRVKNWLSECEVKDKTIKGVPYVPYCP